MFLKRLYFIYAAFWFVLIFLLLYPLFLLSIAHPSLHRFSRIPYKIWSYTFFPLIFLPVKRAFRFEPKSQPYVFVANHSSYLDIPILTYVLPGYFIYIGKESLTKIPLFGPKFKKLHITVNRKDGRDRRLVIDKGVERIRKGQSLVVFPEGGINPNPQPHLRSFKDGAFRIALSTGTPLVPVTIVNTWKIFPDIRKPIAEWHPCRVILDEPIETKGLTEQALPALKEKTRQQMASNLGLA